MWLKRTVFLGAGLYALIIVLGWASQRHYVYLTAPTHETPAAAGLGNVDEQVLATADGHRIVTWWGRSSPGRPTLLYFHGNGGNLARRAQRIAKLMSAGLGVFIMAYRGYSGSTGWPSERRNVADAGLAYDTLRNAGLQPQDIVLYGESLGTGVATELAAVKPAAGLVLDAPFTSIPDVAELRYPFLPMRLFLTERYDNERNIERVHIPLLIIHGEADRIVPVGMGRQVFEAANEPKRIVTFPGAGHVDHTRFGSYDTVIGFVNHLAAPGSTPPVE